MKSIDVNRIHYVSDDCIIDNVNNDYLNEHIKFIWSKEYEKNTKQKCIKYDGVVFVYRILKSGKVSKNSKRIWGRPFIPLHVCELCSRIGTPKKVQHRPHCFSWDKSIEDQCGVVLKTGLLCMGCWNKLRRIIKMQTDVEFNFMLISRIYRESIKYGKQINENNR